MLPQKHQFEQGPIRPPSEGHSLLVRMASTNSNKSRRIQKSIGSYPSSKSRKSRRRSSSGDCLPEWSRRPGPAGRREVPSCLSPVAGCLSTGGGSD